MRELTFFVCTHNSAMTLERCLSSISVSEPDSPVMVIDQHSTDSSAQIAMKFGAEVHLENVGLGYARQLAFQLVQTEFLAFVDSDEELVRPSFFRDATRILQDPRVGAVEGMGVGHRFAYGLPMGFVVLRSRDFRGRVIPSEINAREEYFVQRRLRSLGLSTVFVPNSKVHRSRFRKYKPEWEGANTRIAGGLSLGQLLFVLRVFILQSLNSRSYRNVLYLPVSYLKFLRGYLQPDQWRNLRLVD
ncbi:MAG: glycosyltransferase family 2 protein [Thaumarchaeota archaeon]|nr:glycosyltransferase family 2 protein [Nitrososphaerota archaeon]